MVYAWNLQNCGFDNGLNICKIIIKISKLSVSFILLFKYIIISTIPILKLVFFYNLKK